MYMPVLYRTFDAEFMWNRQFFSAWMTDDQLFPYEEQKEEFVNPKRVPKGFPQAIEAIEDAIKNDPVDPFPLSIDSLVTF